MNYSIDFRKKVIDHLKTRTIHKTAEIFGISVKAICSWKKLLKNNGSLTPKPLVRNPRKIDYAKLTEYVSENPDRYLYEIAEVFGVSACGIGYALKKLGIPLKKRPKYTGNGMSRGVRNIKKK